MSSFLTQQILGIPLGTFAVSFLFIFGGFVLRRVVRMTSKRLSKITDKSRFRLDGMVLKAASKPLEWFCILVGVWLALNVLPLPHDPIDIRAFVDGILKAAGIMIATAFGLRLVDALTERWAEIAAQSESRFDDQMVPIVRSSVRVFVILIAVIVLLQNLGYSVTSLVAGLGIGGMAVALASKDTLANLFGSLVVFLDRPFQIGDWIQMSMVEGAVEEIGLRTTRIRTAGNSLVTLPNMLFTANAIKNVSLREKRRLSITVGLTYDTSTAQVQTVITQFRELLDTNADLHEGSTVFLSGLGPSSLDVTLTCFTQTTSFAEFAQIRQDLLLALMGIVEACGCEFAFPTQTLHLSRD